jgi:hypothetical protein
MCTFGAFKENPVVLLNKYDKDRYEATLLEYHHMNSCSSRPDEHNRKPKSEESRFFKHKANPSHRKIPCYAVEVIETGKVVYHAHERS